MPNLEIAIFTISYLILGTSPLKEFERQEMEHKRIRDYTYYQANCNKTPKTNRKSK